MKTLLLSLLCGCLLIFGGNLSAQNALPVITNLVLTADTATHVVAVQYDLSDADGDPLEMWIQVSADSGRTWRVAIDSLSGDHGYPVMPGTAKMLYWHYRPATLTAFGAGLATYRVRLIADDRQPVDLQAVTDMVDSTRLHAQLLALEGVRHRTGDLPRLEATKDSLEAFMTQYDLHPYRHGSAFGNYVCENVIGRRSGTRNDTATWQISGHFDTVFDSPGGDDNGTAVACVSEAIRVLSNFQTKESLRYFYFDLEEAGLIGSYQYANNGIPQWEQPKGLLNMDCVGFYSQAANSQVMPAGFNILFPAAYNAVQADSFRGNFLTSIVNTASSWLDTVFRSTAVAHVPGMKVITLETPGTGLLTVDLRRSDHAAFWDKGIPAIFFSDGADFRNPNYHTTHDTVGTLDMRFYVQNVRAIVTTLARLAQLEHSTIAEAGAFDIQVPVGNDRPQLLSQVPGLQIVPNPSHGRLEFRFQLPVAGNMKLELRNHHGQLVHVVDAGWREAGEYRLPYQQPLSQGYYAVYLTTDFGSTFQPLVVER